MRITFIVAAWVLAGAAAVTPWAKPPEKSRDPADATAPVAPLRFESGLRARTAEPAVDPPLRWREHNDRVRDIGGHAGHVRAVGGDAASKSVPASPGATR